MTGTALGTRVTEHGPHRFTHSSSYCKSTSPRSSRDVSSLPFSKHKHHQPRSRPRHTHSTSSSARNALPHREHSARMLAGSSTAPSATTGTITSGAAGHGVRGTSHLTGAPTDARNRWLAVHPAMAADAGPRARGAQAGSVNCFPLQ